MSMLGFQRALSKLVMSPPFRMSVAESPEEALAGIDLSDLERKRIEALARDPRMKTGTMIHRSFRLSMLSRTLPRTCTALGSEGIRDWVHAYWQEQLPRSLLYIREGIRFAHWALARMREQGIDNPFLPEVLEAELALLELSRQELWSQEPEAIADGKPRLHPHCRIARFRHDPDLLLSELGAGRVPEDLLEGEHYLLVRSTEPGQVEMSTIIPEAGRVLLVCAGDGSVEEVEAEMVQELVEDGYLVVGERVARD